MSEALLNGLVQQFSEGAIGQLAGLVGGDLLGSSTDKSILGQILGR